MYFIAFLVGIILLVWVGDVKKSRACVGETIEEINKMDGRAFELFMANLFKRNGYKVIITKASRDGGKDLIVTKKGVVSYVELKRYSRTKVSSPLLLKLIGSASADGIKNCIFVTTSGYTKDCIMTANKSKIKVRLMDLNDIVRMRKD